MVASLPIGLFHFIHICPFRMILGIGVGGRGEQQAFVPNLWRIVFDIRSALFSPLLRPHGWSNVVDVQTAALDTVSYILAPLRHRPLPRKKSPMTLSE